MITPNFIFESNLESKQDKINFLNEHKNDFVIMDLTSFSTQPFFSDFPQLVAAISTKLNLTNKCEIIVRSHKEEVIALLEAKGFIPTEIKSNHDYFYLPRILSTIVNEAYYAMEEGIATIEDIDAAMKFGVNYPQGPFEWVKGRELYVVNLLDNLYESTGNIRYRASKKLREASIS